MSGGWGPGPGGLPPYPGGPGRPPAAPPSVVRQVVAVGFTLLSPLLLLLSVQAWRAAGPELTEALNRGLSGREPTTPSATPGSDFLGHAVLGTGLWGLALSAAVAGLVAGRSVVRVLAAVALAGSAGFLPILLLVLRAKDALGG